MSTRQTLADRVEARRRKRLGLPAPVDPATEPPPPAPRAVEPVQLAPGELRLCTDRARPSKVLSKEQYRRTLLYAWVIEHEGAVALFATDSYKLAWLPLACKKPPAAKLLPMPIGVDALKVIEKAGTFVCAGDGSLTAADKKGEVHFDPEDRDRIGRPPEVVALFEKAEKSYAEAAPDDPAAVTRRGFEIGVNTRYLRELGEALGAAGTIASDGLRVQIGDPSAGIIVEPLNDPQGRKGLIMPIRLTTTAGPPVTGPAKEEDDEADDQQ